MAHGPEPAATGPESPYHLHFRRAPRLQGLPRGYLLDFLRSVECQQIYLVGDFIDLWSLHRTFYWPQQHNDVIRTLLGKAKHGTRVVYVPGNHDRTFRDYDGWVLGNVEVAREACHETADGRQFLVMHGDEFDGVIRASPFLESLGNRAYAAALAVNRHFNAVRQRFGYPYWSLANLLKHKVKNAVSYISNFERAVAFEARRRGVDGIICGRIHRAEMCEMDDVTYCNDGDWVESCQPGRSRARSTRTWRPAAQPDPAAGSRESWSLLGESSRAFERFLRLGVHAARPQ